jgi:hypothetical protein
MVVSIQSRRRRSLGVGSADAAAGWKAAPTRRCRHRGALVQGRRRLREVGSRWLRRARPPQRVAVKRLHHGRDTAARTLLPFSDRSTTGSRHRAGNALLLLRHHRPPAQQPTQAPAERDQRCPDQSSRTGRLCANDGQTSSRSGSWLRGPEKACQATAASLHWWHEPRLSMRLAPNLK